MDGVVGGAGGGRRRDGFGAGGPGAMRDDVLPLQPRPIERRRIRVDSVEPGDAGSGSATAGRSLLGLFRLLGNRPAPERRRLPRHAVVESRVWVGWRRGEAGVLAGDALLINLSRGGALVFLDERPPRDRPVWIGLETSGQADCIEARVVAIAAARLGQCAVRLAFLEPCPYAFFEAALCGLRRNDPRRRPRHAAGAGPSAGGEPSPKP
jgi:hypothetical protein